MSKEVWKEVPIEGYCHLYRVSNLGNVMGVKRGRNIAFGYDVDNSYRMANLYDGENRCHIGVHRLVALAFIPNDNPLIKTFVNHKDGNKKNNESTNLEWTTPQENTQHAHDTGLAKAIKGEDHVKAKLTSEQVKWIKDNYKPKDKVFGGRALAEKFGVSPMNISDIVKGKRRSLEGEVRVENTYRKLADEDVIFIRKHYKSRHKEFGLTALAKRYDVSTGIISRIVKGEIYKDVIL